MSPYYPLQLAGKTVVLKISSGHRKQKQGVFWQNYVTRTLHLKKHCSFLFILVFCGGFWPIFLLNASISTQIKTTHFIWEKLQPMQKGSWEYLVLASFPSAPCLFNTSMLRHQFSGPQSIFFITFFSILLHEDSWQNSALILRNLQTSRLIIDCFATCQRSPGHFRKLNTSQKYRRGLSHCQHFQWPPKSGYED